MNMQKPFDASSDGTPRPNASGGPDLSHDALASDMGACGWNRAARYVAVRGKCLVAPSPEQWRC